MEGSSAPPEAIGIRLLGPGKMYSLPATFAKDPWLFCGVYFRQLCDNKVAVITWTSNWALTFIPSAPVSVSVPASFCFMVMVQWVYLKSSVVTPPAAFILFRLHWLSLSCVPPDKFWNSFCCLSRMTLDLAWAASQVCRLFLQAGRFILLTLSVHEHGCFSFFYRPPRFLSSVS